MAKLEWFNAAKLMSKNLVRIEAEGLIGSGVMFNVPLPFRDKFNHCILTAQHVVKKSLASKGVIRLRSESQSDSVWDIHDWSIIQNEAHDHALLMFNCAEHMPPMNGYSILPPESNFVPGVEIGWLGYPDMEIIKSEIACFSHGYISAYLPAEEAYLVDGVSIHGMSGGPAFVCGENGIVVLAGVVTNYFSNKRPSGEILPGMAMFRTVKAIQNYYSSLRQTSSSAKNV